jgi:polyphosphate kinase
MAKYSRKAPTIPLINKEISWLSFNARVLQEASDPTVPLLERLKFLGIYSSNLDEFFRVRVATLKRLLTVGKKRSLKLIGRDPAAVLKEIHKILRQRQKSFEQTYRQLIEELAAHNIHLVDERSLTSDQQTFVQEYFQKIVRPRLFPVMINGDGRFPALRDKLIYLAISLGRKQRTVKNRYALIEVPTDLLSRFVILPSEGNRRFIMLLDDVIRFNLPSIFSAFDFDKCQAYTIKLTRDAELDIDDDIFESYIRKVHKSIKQRTEGQPVRLVHDSHIPDDLLKLILKRLHIGRNDPVISGARYHNFRDFINFPEIGPASLKYPPLATLPHSTLAKARGTFSAIAKKDVMLHVPYQSFDCVLDLLREASIDPNVTSIKITLYRVAQHSAVANALINAVKNGKSVCAVVELQARFDEESNIYWADRLQEAGAKVVFGVPGLKVHAKICLITRRENKKLRQYAVVGTGNFNEETAKVYSDMFLMTSSCKVVGEVARTFEFLEKNYRISSYSSLLVSPFNMRKKFLKLIQYETEAAASGKEARITLKLNHLVDTEMIDQLYEASQAGVDVRLIVRGMFALVTGQRGVSDTIGAIGHVDRFLEHTRILCFHHGGNEKIFITSADWMPRNLDRRVEVACPVLDPDVCQEIRAFLDIQWRDNTKARVLNAELDNTRRNVSPGGKHRAQSDFYEYLCALHTPTETSRHSSRVA